MATTTTNLKQTNAHTNIVDNDKTRTTKATATATATAAVAATLTSKPIKIPERFSSQLSTGSADSGCGVNATVATNGSSSTSLAYQQKNLLLLPSFKSRSTSLSLQGVAAHPKSQLQKLKQPAYRQLLSQDSGIDGETDSANGSQQQLKLNNCSSSSSESLVNNSSGELSAETDVSSGYAGSIHSFGLRRPRYKPCSSAGTLGLGLEDRIDEVEDLHLNENDEDLEDGDDECDDGDSTSLALEEDEDEDDANDSGLQMTVDRSMKSPDNENGRQSQYSNALAFKDKAVKTPKTPTLTSSFSAKQQQVLATDGNYHFPLLNISEEHFINPKLINKKDGLQDTMYYLDEFGSPKLREKYARKQKQKELKLQQQLRTKNYQKRDQTTTTTTTTTATAKRNAILTTEDGPSFADVTNIFNSTNKSKYFVATHCDTNNKKFSHVRKNKTNNRDNDDGNDNDSHGQATVNNEVNNCKKNIEVVVFGGAEETVGKFQSTESQNNLTKSSTTTCKKKEKHKAKATYLKQIGVFFKRSLSLHPRQAKK
uniref:Uncharacterized protein n=1 Tax=Glossina austeni TaxID=7395 RepID=A0A1A9ULE0_GLOAU